MYLQSYNLEIIIPEFIVDQIIKQKVCYLPQAFILY